MRGEQARELAVGQGKEWGTGQGKGDMDLGRPRVDRKGANVRVGRWE